jgi:predicted RNA-binding Zn ribbon-like protein
MFVFVSGHPSLDLLGTLKWRSTEPEEQLNSAADLWAWFLASGLRLTVEATDADVERVRAVRDALYRTFTAIRDARRPERTDVVLLNEIAAAPVECLSLSMEGSVHRQATVSQGLSTLVRGAFNLLDGQDWQRVRDCANPRCTRLFIDFSRAGTRRWCGMTECGNAAKVAAFRARQRDRGGRSSGGSSRRGGSGYAR